MNITLQYFAGCPNWKDVDVRLGSLEAEGVEFEVDHQLIDTPEMAEQFGFRGSPTILVDGVDPFADPDAPVGLACRVYRTDTAYAGSPSLDQLRTVLVGAD